MKKLLRKKAVKLRKEMDHGDHVESSSKICDRLIALPEYKESKTIMGYMAKGHEVDISAALEHAIENKKKLVLPKVIGRTLVLHEVTDISRSLRKGSFDILEPTKGSIVRKNEVGAFLVPGVLFDKSGNRLGHGHGFIDRLLKGANGTKIGICHDWQLEEKIPAGKSDVPMDIIITESNIVRVTK